MNLILGKRITYVVVRLFGQDLIYGYGERRSHTFAEPR